MAVVADALVSKVLDVLASTIAEEIRRVTGVEEEVDKLTSSLQSIQAVLVDAERRQWKEPTTVQLWLDRLRSVAYNIDDVVDEWSYEILKSQTERDENTHKPRRKVWCFKLLSACYCFPKAVARHHMAVKISDLNARLDVIAAEKDRYNFQSLESNIFEHNRTTSVIDITDVRGREADKDNLISMLLSGNGEQKTLRVISIVGMGGIGKTTLARLVYNDELVKSRFHKRIWVCVSDPFDETRIAKEILESLLDAKPNLDALPNIMKRIQEIVGRDEYLFILDDVWNEDRGKWEQLKNCLNGSASKSCILVTTRNEKVGRIMGCLESNMFPVRELSKEISWELFCMIAYFGKSSGEKISLEKIGREVVERCKGLPLAIKAIAGVLQLKKSMREWKIVLDSELWNWEGFERDIAPALWLSYYDLPSHLKQCFSYCVIFPKDYEMEKDELIRHWLAQGYIIGTQSKDMELVGEEYFQNLVMRSFFQEVDVSIWRTSCKMHDIVHDFAQLLVKKECLSIEINGVNEDISFDNDSSIRSLRHLRISIHNKVKFADSFYNLKKLRTLIIVSSSLVRLYGGSLFFELDLQKLFNEFILLRSLGLSHSGIVEVPSNINRLIHLRELDLSRNIELKKLPDTIWELYNLQILNLEGTGIQFVKGIERLANLRYLRNIETKCFLPKEMVRLSGLRRLNLVNINVNKVEALSLKHLTNFNQLCGDLKIRWIERGDGDNEDARQAQLKDKQHISQLRIDFGWEDRERSKQDEDLVEVLNAPPNLEFLHIDFYMGTRTPKWLLSLTAVKTIWLDIWRNCEHLPPLGNLPCLEHLELGGFNRVAKVGSEFLGTDEMTKSTTISFFPNLKSLCFDSLINWEEWNDLDEEMLIMPYLTHLKIGYCQKLKALPNFILKKTSIKLDIHLCAALGQSTS